MSFKILNDLSIKNKNKKQLKFFKVSFKNKKNI